MQGVEPRPRWTGTQVCEHHLAGVTQWGRGACVRLDLAVLKATCLPSTWGVPTIG